MMEDDDDQVDLLAEKGASRDLNEFYAQEDQFSDLKS